MDRAYRSMLLAIVLVFATGAVVMAQPRVAVMDFENKSQYGGWRLGRGAADILTTELVKIGKFDVMEREQLLAVIQEQNLGAAGRVDPSTAAQIGKIVGVSYIITGAVTEYGQSRHGGGGGGVNVGKKGYHATVDIRMVDATTSRIVFADSASESKSTMNVRVFGIGGGESFNEKRATEVMRTAIQKLVTQLGGLTLSAGGTAVAGSGGDAGGSSAKALVADVDGSNITLNKGAAAGIENGKTYEVYRKDKEIKDPATGKVLKVKYKTVGKIKMTAVEDSYSEATVASGAGFKVGDMVR